MEKLKYKEKDKVKIKKTYLHKEIAGKEVVIDYIDEGHGGNGHRDAYFILHPDGGAWFEVDDDDIEEVNSL